MQFKDNTLYSAIKPKVLRLECMILKTLDGQHYNLHLEGLYESSSTIYIVTDYCPGGDMFQYISQVYGKDDLRTEDVSRISFQLLDAISHCAKYGIIHRDIKVST
jgi:calcium-dependent protein kinase